MPTMNDDIKKYPIYILYAGQLQTAEWVHNTDSYDHYNWELHHFIRKSVRKNSEDFYNRVEHLQKLILVPKQINSDLETMGEKAFFKKHGLNKNDLVFSRLKWREGYYDKEG